MAFGSVRMRSRVNIRSKAGSWGVKDIVVPFICIIRLGGKKELLPIGKEYSWIGVIKSLVDVGCDQGGLAY